MITIKSSVWMESCIIFHVNGVTVAQPESYAGGAQTSQGRKPLTFFSLPTSRRQARSQACANPGTSRVAQMVENSLGVNLQI